MEHDVPKVEYSYGLMPACNSYNVIFYSKFYHHRKNEIARVTQNIYRGSKLSVTLGLGFAHIRV